MIALHHFRKGNEYWELQSITVYTLYYPLHEESLLGPILKVRFLQIARLFGLTRCPALTSAEINGCCLFSMIDSNRDMVPAPGVDNPQKCFEDRDFRIQRPCKGIKRYYYVRKHSTVENKHRGQYVSYPLLHGTDKKTMPRFENTSIHTPGRLAFPDVAISFWCFPPCCWPGPAHYIKVIVVLNVGKHMYVNISYVFICIETWPSKSYPKWSGGTCWFTLMIRNEWNGCIMDVNALWKESWHRLSANEVSTMMPHSNSSPQLSRQSEAKGQRMAVACILPEVSWICWTIQNLWLA